MDWMPIETRPDEGEFLAYDPISGRHDVCYSVTEAEYGPLYKMASNVPYGDPFILMRDRIGQRKSCIAVQYDGEYGPNEDEFQGSRATHWMPLPPPPNNAKVAEGEENP